MATLYPTRYGSRLVTIDQLFAEHHEDKMHPEFRRRLRRWLIEQGGLVGIGGSWRATGSQPDKPGFAPEGKSFHQDQYFASGMVKFCAVDLVCRNNGLVHRAPRWDEVPVQGSAESLRWGVHANVRTESWHMQPIEIDGWQSWVNGGRHDPAEDRPIPPLEQNMRVINPPRRLIDTRTTEGRLRDGETLTVQIPGDATAAFVNLTVVKQSKRGFATMWDGATQRPAVSNLNFGDGGPTCNTSWVPVSGFGTIAVWVSASCDVIVDLQAVAS